MKKNVFQIVFCGKLGVVRAFTSQWGFTRHSSINFSLGIVRDIVPPIMKHRYCQEFRHILSIVLFAYWGQNRIVFYRTFLVACYTTLWPAMFVGQFVGPSPLTFFCRFTSFQVILGCFTFGNFRFCWVQRQRGNYAFLNGQCDVVFWLTDLWMALIWGLKGLILGSEKV